MNPNMGEFFELFSDSFIPLSEITPAGKLLIGDKKILHYRLQRETILNLGIVEYLNAPEPIKDLYRKCLSPSYKEKRRIEIMAIVNGTPDSFYSGSRFMGNLGGLSEILDQKPDIIDVGGESTRPGSMEIQPAEEIKRLKPIIEYISGSSDIRISLDTRHPEVVERYVSEIDMINDISGFRSGRMIEIASENKLDCVVMHMRGTPWNMNQLTDYSDIYYEISEFLLERTHQMLEKNIMMENIILDPGIGFSKTYSQNINILKNIHKFDFGLKTLVGASRKSFIGRITDDPPEKRLSGSLAAAVWCAMNGVDIIRTHDPGETRRALDVISAIQG